MTRSTKPDTESEENRNLLETRRTPDFVSRYANNIQIESTSFDLKLVFGILDQGPGIRKPGTKPIVDQHTAMSLSWVEAKLLLFYLQVQLAGYEQLSGTVKIPAVATPPEPALTPELDNPQGRAAIELIRGFREALLK